jgi:ABC-2 type transport system ATP-binding protein
VAAVEVNGLVVRYGDLEAVRGVSFTADAGRVTAVLGPNGAGKTSTIEVCEGYRTGSAGTVRVLGMDPATDQRKLGERIGVMLQQGGVYPSARVLDTVRHYCTLYGKGADAAALVEAVGLTARAKATWRRLSGGEQQRLSLALALAAKPEVAFLDEPTSGVDVNGRDTIRAIVRGLADSGCAVVLPRTNSTRPNASPTGWSSSTEVRSSPTARWRNCAAATTRSASAAAARWTSPPSPPPSAWWPARSAPMSTSSTHRPTPS